MKTKIYYSEQCPICGKSTASPYRRRDQHGKIVEGCVDEFHTGYLIGDSARWHNSPQARKIRAAMKTGRMGGVTHFKRESNPLRKRRSSWPKGKTPPHLKKYLFK